MSRASPGSRVQKRRRSFSWSRARWSSVTGSSSPSSARPESAEVNADAGGGTDFFVVQHGLAIGVSNNANFLFAADNLNNKVDIYDKSFHFVKSFTDTSLPAGAAPYNVQNIGGQLYVTFTTANGSGVVDIFDTAGNKIKTLISGGHLHTPWGIALAPSNFGPASKALLVGNLGDGFIHAYNPTTGAYLGQSAVSFDGLWALIFGGGGGSTSNGQTNQLFLTAGPGGYSEGLFSVVNVK